MQTETLLAIAKLAEDKHARIELLPTGFCITVKSLVRGRGMTRVKQMISYAEAEQLEKFEAAINAAIARLHDAVY